MVVCGIWGGDVRLLAVGRGVSRLLGIVALALVAFMELCGFVSHCAGGEVEMLCAVSWCSCLEVQCCVC